MSGTVKLAERIQALERQRDEALYTCKVVAGRWQYAHKGAIHERDEARADIASQSEDISRLHDEVGHLEAESEQWQEAAGQSLVRAETAEDERDKAREQVRVLREFVSDLDGYASARRSVESAQLKTWIKQLRAATEPKP